ncbi:MAG: flagellar hook-basal body complex protein [Burkholderiaceae bacterium]|nr:flagellar hook-basal body complex protein [Burkholderiaceae bacterium]
MSFYTALTGLNAATASLGVISNNIANVGTTGFKKSRADFGDIFATSPLQKASSVIGQGVALKAVTQEFSQGNLQFSANSLDIAITGDGFFPLKSADGLQDIYTRNGTFLLDDSFAVVNSAGQALMAASVDSSGKADLENLGKLIIPRSTNGDARETTAIELGLNLPAQGDVITAEFDPSNPETYNLTTAVTVFDAGGNEYLATVYYVKTQRASPDDPTNKWQTHVFIGDTKLDEFLIQAASAKDELLYVNKYGQVLPEDEIPPQDIARGVTKLFNLDELTNKSDSDRATYEGDSLPANTVELLKTGQFSVADVIAPERELTAGVLTRVTAFPPPIVGELGGLGSIDGLLDAATGNETNRPTTTPEIFAYLSIDESPNPVKVDVSELYDAGVDAPTYSGVELARFLEAKINKAYGDQNYFDISSLVDENETAVDGSSLINLKTLRLTSRDGSTDTVANLSVSLNQINHWLGNGFTGPTLDANGLVTAAPTATSDATYANISPAYTDPVYTDDGNVDITKLTPDQLEILMKNAVASTANATYRTDFGTTRSVQIEDISDLAVEYSPARQNFVYTTTDGSTVSVRAFGSDVSSSLFELTSAYTAVDPDTGVYEGTVAPNGLSIRSSNVNYSQSDQRYGIRVQFDDTTQNFRVLSGTTGDEASVEVLFPPKVGLAGGSDTTSVTAAELSVATGATLGTETATDLNILSRDMAAFLNFQSIFNFSPGETTTESLPTRGVRSTPAIVDGSPIGLNLDNKFTLTADTNTFTVTVDNVTGLIQLPTDVEYTSETFRQALETRINSLEDSRGRTVNGVTVEYKTEGTATVLEIKTGTEGNDSFLKVSGPTIWGLADLPAARGNTEQWLVPPQAENENGVPLYVDRDGNETPEAGEFSEEETRELWSPIFLDKGELTFNTRGELTSPAVPIGFKATTIGETGATLQFSINYDGTTQFSSPFSVVAQDQNGRPEGDLIGLDIGDDGLVSANYSNGSQKNLAKIVLANFSAPTGLRQIGDASFFSTSKSGAVQYGEAGTAGFGTIRAGARERANVDLTQELIDLITAQRAFQANAKAIETNNTLTQAIINIRS